MPKCGDDPKDVPPNCVPYTPNRAYYEEGCEEPVLIPFLAAITIVSIVATVVWWLLR